MTIWELVMSRMKVLGAINLISAFPPLANAMVLSLYASNVKEEAEVRGWPSEVYEFMEGVRRRIGYEVVSEVLSRLSEHLDFVENLGYMIYYDLLGRSELATTAFNYVSSLEDIGFSLAPHITCLDQGLAERVVSLSGGSILDLRALDLAFIVKVRSRYGGEPVEDVGEEYDIYTCSPSWIIKVRDKVLKAVNIDYDEEFRLVKQTLLDLIRSNRRLYAYLKLAYTHGARVAWEKRTLVNVLPGRLESLNPLISLATENSIPAINYTLKDTTLKAMDSVERELLKGGYSEEGDEVIVLEALPTLYTAKPGEVFTVKPINQDDVRLAELIASKLGLEVVAEGAYIKLKPKLKEGG